MENSEDADTRPVATRLTTEMHQRLQERAETEGYTTKAELVRSYIRDGLEESTKPTPKDRITNGILILFTAGYPALLMYYGQHEVAVFTIFLYTLIAVTYPEFNTLLRRATERAQSFL